MASVVYDLTPEWSATNRITAAGDIDLAVTNPSTHLLYWVITTSTTVPSIAMRDAHFARPVETWFPSLVAGEYLWLAGKDFSVTVGP